MLISIAGIALRRLVVLSPQRRQAGHRAARNPAGDSRHERCARQCLRLALLPHHRRPLPAAYFVGEQLASLSIPSTASGTTGDVDGEFQLTADGTALAADTTSQFTVGLTSLQSDESLRDNRVRGALETGLFPTATFTLTSFTGYDPLISEGEQQDIRLTGTLDLHGVHRQATWTAEVLRQART